MTYKEKLVEVLKGIPDELVNKAYSLNLGTNGLTVALNFDSEYLKHYPPDKVEIGGNGFLTFYIEAGGEQVEVTMS